ncbi:MAG: hypothetical protein RR998_00325 [Oscillospiraceae bacterium]
MAEQKKSPKVSAGKADVEHKLSFWGVFQRSAKNLMGKGRYRNLTLTGSSKKEFRIAQGDRAGSTEIGMSGINQERWQS